jgi:hypothetical protein
MFRPTQGHPQANKERTRNSKKTIKRLIDGLNINAIGLEVLFGRTAGLPQELKII